MTFEQALKARMPDCALQKNVRLAPFTTMKIGGEAELFLEITDEETLLAALSAARETSTPVFILGNGSNLLISDAGVAGLVLRLGEGFRRVEFRDGLLVAQAGALLSTVARAAQSAGLSGLQFAAGIPGSVGGATAMNAGAYGGEIAGVLSYADIVENGRLTRVQVGDMDYFYRHSRLTGTDAVVVRAAFKLSPGEPDAILAEMNELARRRREKQPLAYASAGSFFKRPTGYFSGALIEGAGLKGLRVGDAQVSEKHAGFLVNLGRASFQDMLTLMQRVQDTVYKKYGVRLEPEVKIIGRAP